MTLPKIDICRLIVLFLLLIVCAITGIQRSTGNLYSYFHQTDNNIHTVPPDNTVCENVKSDVTYEECIEFVKNSYADANNDCNGYSKKLESCLSKYREPGCRLQAATLESCVKTIVQSKLDEWGKIQN